jgi:hypothetical protein
MNETYEAAAEIRDVIGELASEVKLLRLVITAMHKTFQDVIDPGSGERFPGYIRMKDIDRAKVYSEHLGNKLQKR